MSEFTEALLHQKRYAEAARRYRQALALDDSDPQLWLGLARAEQGRDQRDAARIAFQQALDRGLPDPSPELLPLTDWLIETGDVA